MAGLETAFLAVVLLVLSATGAATVLLQTGRSTNLSTEPAPTALPASHKPQAARITFLQDNPWFNCGETIFGTLVRRDRRSFLFTSDLEPDQAYLIPDDPAHVRIEFVTM